mgnify:CR=1 FL=1
MKSLLELIFWRAQNSWNSLFVSLLLTPLLVFSPATALAQSSQTNIREAIREAIQSGTQADAQPSNEAQSPAISQQLTSPNAPALHAQLRTDPAVEITDIQLIELEDGLQVVLVADRPEEVEVFQFQAGATLTVDVTNARLSLSEGESYQQLNPIPGVASLNVEQRGSEIQITVVSTDETPPVAYFERLTEALQFDVVTAAPGQTDTDIDLDSNNLRIIVTAAPLGYRVPNASIGTRTDTAIIDVPQAIQVISEEVIEDQNVQTLNDALRNASGVSTGRANVGARSATPLIRGFENNNNILRNGLRDDTLQFGSALPNVERIEILKGPASVLFGAGDLGGTVNLVTETPPYEPRYEFEFNGGSFGEYGASMDFGGPLDAEGKLAYRLNIEYSGEESFVDFQDSDFLFVSPALQIVNTDDTSLILELEYLRSRARGGSTGLPAYAAIGLEDNSLIDTILENEARSGQELISDEERELAGTADFSTNLGEPPIGRSEVNITRIGYRFNHEFSDDWKFNHEFLGSFQETPRETFIGGISTASVAGNPDLSSVSRLFLSNPSERESYLFNTNVVGEFDVFGIDQTFLFGSEVSFEKERDVLVTVVGIPPINIFDPDYGQGNLELSDLEGRRPSGDSRANRNRYSFYGQTQLDFFDGDLIALLGGRLDIIDQDFINVVNPNNPEPILNNETAFSPRVGLVYKPADNVSIYASYSESFNPLPSEAADGSVFEPEEGRQIETGIKANFFDDRLSATLAYFDLVRQNVSTEDPVNRGFQVQVGEQKSAGIEFDLAGELSPGWNVIANYAYIDSTVTDDNIIEEGTRLINAPRHSANLWTTYQVQSGDLAGLGFGFGLSFVGDRNGELRRPFKIPSYTRADASIFYEKDSFRSQINFENLFDTRYIEGARDQFRVQPGAPFSMSASVNWTF